MESNFKICECCNQEFYKEYLSRGRKNFDSFSGNIRFCSKSCATKYQRNKGVIITKEVVEEEILEFIRSNNRYSSFTEIYKGIGRSSKTLQKLGIKIVDLNRSIGYGHDFSKSSTFSIFSVQIFNVLKTIYPDIIREYSCQTLISPRGYLLRIDFYIPSQNLMIEADGTQHYDVNNPWYSKYNKQCDEIKNQYCHLNNTKLIRIPYKRQVTQDYILDCINKP